MNYRPGEIVDVTIKGACVEVPEPGQETSLTLAYHEVSPGVHATLVLTHLADNVTVERVAPEHWPPRKGDIWTDDKGREWFTYQQPRGGIALVSNDGGSAQCKDLLSVAPLTLTRRDGGIPA